MSKRMSVLVGGGTGFVGSALVQQLAKQGFKPYIVTRTPLRNSIVPHVGWDRLEKEGFSEPCKGVINLSGENLMNPTKRWTEDFKNALYDSRIKTTRMLAKLISEGKIKTDVFISTSAIGFYEPSRTAEYTESSPGGASTDFMSNLCAEWEGAARLPSEANVRHATVRIGLVMGRTGGMIQNSFWPFYFGGGGPMGSGEQWTSWIHLHDLVNIFIHILKQDNLQGVFNGTSPNPCTNREFAKAFGAALGRPALLPMPEFVLRALLGTERAAVVTEGQRVLPKRVLESGYQFLYPTIAEACKEVARISWTADEEERAKMVKGN